MSNAEPIVYVVDDDASVRRSLQWLVESIGLKAAALASAREFLTAYDASQPGCLVLDLRMPDMSGLELQEELARRGQGIPVIIITGYGEIPAAVRAMKAGAIDFIEKPFSEHTLLERIQEAAGQAVEVFRDRQARLELTTKVRCLTPREATVMQCVVDGLANKQIAARLNLSEKTVEVHRSRLMKKLGAHSVAELVRIALRVSNGEGFPMPADDKP